MKTLTIVLAIFFALCTAMLLNFIYINESADELTHLTEELSFDDPSVAKKIEEIEKKWEKSSVIFSLTVNFKDIDYLGESLVALKSSARTRDKDEFERYRLLVIDAIDGVRRLERFSVMNIL